MMKVNSYKNTVFLKSRNLYYPPDFDDMHKWNNTIQKMADAFELMKYAGATHTKEEERTIEQGLDLFRKYYRNLWD